MRIGFLLYQTNKTEHLSLQTIAASFWYGLKMDLSVAAYITAPICIFIILGIFISLFRKLSLYRAYTFFVLLIVSLVSFADLEIYKQWGFRIDATPLKFLTTPREVYASISHLPIVLYLALFAILYTIVCLGFNFVLRKIFFPQQENRKLLTFTLILLVLASLVIPIRGGFQLSPLNQSSVYFSTNNYANHAAINASWNFMHSLVNKNAPNKNPYLYLSFEAAHNIKDSLFKNNNTNEEVISIADEKPPNVILIIWESFTEKALHISVNKKEVLPHFKRLKKEGIYFSNAYASGDRTNKGIPAILSGYPAMPNTTIIYSAGKSEKLEVLSDLFKKKGYYTPFYYGGEPEFANIKSYLLHGSFDPIIGKNDFAPKDMNSKWGAHDGVVMNRVFNNLDQSAKPFFATWLTLSSHEPFETPLPNVFNGNNNTIKFLNSLHYTDGVIGEFVDKCKRMPWWNNTIIIITGDHGHPLPATNKKADDFRIPMLWTGGALKKRGVVLDRVVSQLDIASSLTRQFGIDTAYFPFSKNIFDPSTSGWAFFTFNNGFGFVDSSGRLVFDNTGRLAVQQEGSMGPGKEEAGKALMQIVYDDFLKK